MEAIEVLEKVDSLAKILGVSPSGVKKYYLMFEKAGYLFKRNNDGHVIFSPEEVAMFKTLMVLKKQPYTKTGERMTVEKAILEIVAYRKNTGAPVTTKEVSVITDIEKLIKQHIDPVTTHITGLEQQLKTVITNQEKLSLENKMIMNQQQERNEQFNEFITEWRKNKEETELAKENNNNLVKTFFYKVKLLFPR